jgi:predicted RNA binding protein YcfA (HicA-like mRNA interferase family)
MGSEFGCVMPKKIREIKALLIEAGFSYTPGKGSHSKWQHPLLNRPVIIARKDGDDAPLYLEKQVRAALRDIEDLQP